MNHWQMIALAYSLTFFALALELVLLMRRRRAALRQAREWLDGVDPQTAGGRSASGGPDRAGAAS